MPVDGFRLFQLAAQGFCCSQILLIIGLEEEGKDAPELIRAMHGLCGGMGRSGATCGVLTGGACLLGLVAGKGTVSEQSHPQIHRMVQELLEWFEETYGSLLCEDILHYKLEEGTDYPVKCGSTISATYDKVQELVATYLETEKDDEEC
ncbi:DVU_1555 family C-GCAxxG-C-C protein [Desulfitobacterium sp. PCE1]|uniref:DVU_1555 family C-GCAxxG-C-C protein n=1 Tax=Desulfitobacterium sp. PCE1 TaxID=146907 RepID=UPI00036C06CC|nr:DV_1555 family C-GCAxxG-C-C protein [Desulfitobacterium sp. PCE1]